MLHTHYTHTVNCKKNVNSRTLVWNITVTVFIYLFKKLYNFSELWDKKKKEKKKKPTMTSGLTGPMLATVKL